MDDMNSLVQVILVDLIGWFGALGDISIYLFISHLSPQYKHANDTLDVTTPILYNVCNTD